MVDFARFFAAAHATDGVTGPDPYPWQSALAHRLATAAPPKAISVPTGGGKTAAIDALVWALAQQADRSPLLRTIGVRTVWAIDRRILVDEVHDHVSCLAERLAWAATDESDPMHDIAVALQSLTGDGSPPLVATRWRGGVPVDRRVRHPLQPEIITSTVAQVGSRLLFRGYGVGRRSLSLQAALTAVDTTICLDEAHIAEPFRETVEAVAAHREREALALPPLHVITLTATPAVDLADHQVAEIGQEDRRVLGPRLTGEKRARLVEPAGDRDADRRAALLDAVVEHVEAGAGSVACVVNSVRMAIEMHRAVRTKLPDVAAVVLIGPQRPVDRSRVMAEHRGVLFDREMTEKPLVLIATQTFEVGLDADVEALVTQSASASALIQRLGRCNRAGLRRGAVTIVRDTGAWLYEHEEPAAWAWLQSMEEADETIDVSVDGLSAAANRPVPRTGFTPPELTAAVIDRLVQTEPRPAPMDDPDIDAFLRGVESEPSADVSVLWRCDLRDTETDPAAVSYRQALLRLAPPTAEECVTLSIGRARGLLAALRAGDKSRAKFAAAVLDEPDVEGVAGDVIVPGADPLRAFEHIVLRGGEHLDCGHTERDPIRPGDVVVLPARVGGYADDTVDHASAAIVPDVAPDLAGSAMPGFWRITTEVLSTMRVQDTRSVYAAARGAVDAVTAEERDVNARTLLQLLLEASGRGTEMPGWTTLAVRRVTEEILDIFGGDGNDDFDAVDEPSAEPGERLVSEGFVLVIGNPMPEDALPASAPPTLDAHAQAVTGRVTDYTARLTLPDVVAESLRVAARGHDHGKSDPRIQAFFHGGTARLGHAVLAKSVFGTADIQKERAARVASGLPRDLRHEVASAAVVQDAIAAGGIDRRHAEIDEELLLHLVGTHHGLGRPIPRRPHDGTSARSYTASAAGIVGTADGDGRDAWADGAWLERFLSVTDRYGAWGSAYVGALLVLADRTVSAEGS